MLRQTRKHSRYWEGAMTDLAKSQNGAASGGP